LVLGGLQEQPAQIAALTDHYVLRWAMKHDRVITEVDPAVPAMLAARDWPGGVAQLKAELEAAVLRCEAARLTPACFRVRWTSDHDDAPGDDGPEDEPQGELTASAAEGPLLDEPARRWIEGVDDLRAALTVLHDLVYEEALRRDKGNKTAAARRLGIKRANLVKRLKERGHQGGQEP
jgi:DNA-binding NtrC family response regulator